jgi:hypothetical protein
MNIVLFSIFIFFLPTQLAKHFWPDFAFVNGVRIDYLALKLYFTDILATLMIAANIKIIYLFIKQQFCKFYPRYKNIFFILILLIMGNVVLAISPTVAFFKLTKVLQLLLLSLTIYLIFDEKLQEIFYKAVALSTIFQCYLVILQLYFKKSIDGIFYYFGERFMNLATPNIAKASLNGVEFLRPYGTFSHPNSMGGFFLLLYGFLIFMEKKSYKKIKYFTLAVLSILILCSFSKVVIGTFFLVNILYFITKKKNNRCILCNISKIFIFFILAIIFMSAQGDILTIEKRIWLAESAVKVIADNPIFGTGIGNYLLAQSQFAVPYPHHFLQPVHNIFLLILAELGFSLVVLLIYLLFKLLKQYKIGYQLLAYSLIIGCTGFFDHYWLTLQQNLLLLAVLFGQITKLTNVNIKNKDKNDTY